MLEFRKIILCNPESYYFTFPWGFWMRQDFWNIEKYSFAAPDLISFILKNIFRVNFETISGLQYDLTIVIPIFVWWIYENEINLPVITKYIMSLSSALLYILQTSEQWPIIRIVVRSSKIYQVENKIYGIKAKE